MDGTLKLKQLHGPLHLHPDHNVCQEANNYDVIKIIILIPLYQVQAARERYHLTCGVEHYIYDPVGDTYTSQSHIDLSSA